MIPIEVARAGPRATAVDALRRALDDPAVDLLFWRSATGSWIDALGQPVTNAEVDAGRSVTPLERDGDWVAAVVHDPALLADPERVRTASVATMAAIDDERLKAELLAQLRDEQASRLRILAAGDRQRRRVERNLHDGAQQRLVGLALTLRLATRQAKGDPALAELLSEAVGELDDAIEELRELARGLHPAILSDAGLAGGLETLAERPGIPVDLSVDLPDRLPSTVEVCAYYFVAEALANANKHSGATHVTVRATVDGAGLDLAVSDDGRGGAAAASGSGLEGLADRVGAIGGHLVIRSDPGRGTTVAAHMPLQAPSALPHYVLDDILLRIVPAEDSAGPYEVGTARHARWLRGDRDRRLRALKWVAWHNHEVPGEILEAQPEAEDLLHAKALLLCAGGNRQMSDRRRDWILGYLTAAGHPESVIEAARVYDDTDRLEDIMSLPKIARARLGIVYDALRACASDGADAPGQLDPVLRAADAMGISRDLVADLHQIVLEEQALRRRRHDIVVSPSLPKALHDSISETAGRNGSTGSAAS